MITNVMNLVMEGLTVKTVVAFPPAIPIQVAGTQWSHYAQSSAEPSAIIELHELKLKNR